MDAILKPGSAAVLIALAATVAAVGCGEDDCSTLSSAFELEVRLDIDGERPPIGSLRINLEAGEERWWRIYDVSMALEDDQTSFAVELLPARTRPTPISIELSLFTGPETSGVLLVRKEQGFQLQSNACNAFVMELDISQ